MGSVMFPRIIVGDRGADGHQVIPASAVVNGATVTIWTTRFATRVGSLDAFEYRDAADNVFVVARVANAGARVGSLLYVPVPEGADDVADLRGLRAALVAGGTIARSWAFAVGVRRVAALESDGGALATAIKAAWPATWREWQAGDVDVPTGPRTLAEVLA